MRYSVLILTVAAVGVACAQTRERGFMRFSPMLSAIDADHDGVISEGDLQGAASALRSLDKNGDGRLTRDEVRPAMGPGRGPGGPGGGDRPEMVKNMMQFDKDGDGRLSKAEVPERMQRMFDRDDTNRDGFLTPGELKTMAEAQPRRGGGRQGGPGGGGGMMRGEPVFAALDTDRDGEISAAELTNATASLKNLDRNNDGNLTADEVRPAFGPGPGGNPEQMVSRMFEQHDANGDGKLSKDEMPERMQEIFAGADADKDGFVGKEEMRREMESRRGGFGGRQRRGNRQ